MTPSTVFCDFGTQFPVIDTNGETPLQGMIVSIDEEGIVTTLDETRHGLEDGDFVTFSEVKGMNKLNGAEPRKITVKGGCSIIFQKAVSILANSLNSQL